MTRTHYAAPADSSVQSLILQYDTVPACLPHLLMTISPSRVVLGDVRTLVAVSSRGLHLRVGARPPPREHLKEDETRVRKCACWAFMLTCARSWLLYIENGD